MKPLFVSFAAALFLAPAPLTAQTGDMETFENARYVENDLNEGDSFMVEFERDGEVERHLVKLYFIDGPETSAADDSERRRTLEQVRYFGLTQPEELTSFGFDAAEFSRKQLAAPFQLRTAFAAATDRGTQPRIYGMVTTADGEDLAELLVRNGWARQRGIGRALPDGTSAKEQSGKLRRLENEAKAERKGIWAASLE